MKELKEFKILNFRIWGNKHRPKKKIKEIMADIIGLMIVISGIWLLVSLMSLYLRAQGADIPYMPFWHKPWQWLADFLKGG